MSPKPRHSSSNRALYARMLRYVRPYRTVLVAGLIFSALAASMEPILPWMLQYLIDSGFGAKTGASQSLLHRQPWIAPLAIIGAVFVRGTVTFCATYAIAKVRNGLVNDIRQQMFDHLVRLPAAYFERTASAHVVTRLTSDVNSIGQTVTLVGVTILRESLTIVVLMAWLFYINWKLTLVTLVSAPLIAFNTRYISKRLRTMSRASQVGLRSMTQTLLESIHCQKILKVFGGEKHQSQRFAKVNDEMLGYATRSATASALGSPLTILSVSISIAIVVYMALLLAANNETTAGKFMGFIAGMMMLLAPLRNLSGVNLPLQQGLAAAESAFELLDMPGEEETGSYSTPRIKGAIEFRNVSFAYPDAETPALQDVSFSAAAGQTVALVGASGGGKSTLASLLPRFHSPSQGEIRFDDIPIQQFLLSSLRAQTAIVSQETLLFDDTVAANIAYGGMANASQAEIEAAAEAAHALEFIRALPEGFNTRIGENGSRLSGGQRQRIAIARALLKNAPVLILDEATSALDAESERQVQAALDRLMKGRTTLVIAHRLTTIEKADQIVVLEQGRVAETGTHETLLARNGYYARLYRANEIS